MNIESNEELQDYLRRSKRIDKHETVASRVLSGGVSNRTILVVKADGTRWVIKQVLEKLRVKSDWFSSPERIQREALGIRWLASLVPANSIPQLVFDDFDEYLLAMEAVPEPHVNWKDELLHGTIDPELVRQFGSLLGTIHRRSTEQNQELRLVFDDRRYFDSLRLKPYLGSLGSVAWMDSFEPRAVRHAVEGGLGDTHLRKGITTKGSETAIE